MAVPKKKRSRSRRGHHRSHQGIQLPCLSKDSTTGEFHRRHHVTESFYYRGKEMIQKFMDDDSEKSE
jgi:large subunit ribosomal protein L32